ncbi:MAG: Gfo/Idh/MocA family protein [Candidatus Kariarchaeaceae archaeon]|jgi:predicted dehydrogenase
MNNKHNILNWGIIGTGMIAYDVSKAIKLIPDNYLVAAASRDKETLKAFSEINNINKIYDHYDDLIKDSEVNIIYIAIPNSLHADVIEMCFMYGKHVLCEKPLTLNANQAKKIKRLGQSSERFCMEAMWTRFIPSFQKVCSLIKEGSIGDIKMIRGSFGQIINQKRCLDLSLGGGVLLDLGSYLISLTYALLGNPDDIVGNLTIGNSGVDEQASISLKYRNGAIASLNCSYQTKLDNEYTIFGESGRITICSPFYRSSKLRIIRSADTGRKMKHLQSTEARKWYSNTAALKILKKLAKVSRKVIRYNSNKLTIPFEGNGYNHEILEVNNCLKSQQIESKVMPLDDSIAVLQIMDEVRKKWNLIYPSE